MFLKKYGKNVRDKKIKTQEIIETQYQKLEGPKVVNKIDLTQFDKPKTSKDDDGQKKKRKRLKKPVDINSQQNQKPSEGEARKQKGNKPSQNKEQLNPKDKKQKNNKSKQVKKVELDEGEIEKQIRDTLARLSPMGKSKTSKHNREKRQKVHEQIEKEQELELLNQNVLKVTEFVTANELATMMNVPVTKIIATCMPVNFFVYKPSSCLSNVFNSVLLTY